MQNQLSPTRSLSSTIGNVVLWLLAAAGAICIILVVVGLWLNISIMMFRTGSMEPTIETGSVALVREIPAVEITEGDVVTVDRGEELLPVTHRVTEITDVNETTGEVTFVCAGMPMTSTTPNRIQRIPYAEHFSVFLASP